MFRTVDASAVLAEARRRIDCLDEQIVRLLDQRFTLCIEIGRQKRILGIPATDPKRVQVVLRNAERWGRETGIQAEFCRAVYELVLGEAARLESEIITSLD